MRFVCSSAAIAILALCCAPLSAYAQPADIWTRSTWTRLRLGVLAHDIEPNGNQGGVDFNIELLFKRRPRSTARRSKNVLLRPALPPRLLPQLRQRHESGLRRPNLGRTSGTEAVAGGVFGGVLHDGRRLRAQLAWLRAELPRVPFDRLPAVGPLARVRNVTHISNADLCDQNSGLTSAGVRFGYTLELIVAPASAPAFPQIG
jgi:hypothetical protein